MKVTHVCWSLILWLLCIYLIFGSLPAGAYANEWNDFADDAIAFCDKPPADEPMTQSCSTSFATGYTLSGNGAADMVSIALAQEGRTGAEFGYTEGWCADFVSDCAILAGQQSAIPQYGGVKGLMTRIIDAGGIVITSNPKPGDICFIDWNKNGGYAHVEIVYDVFENTVFTIGGNSGSGDSLYTRYVKKHPSLNPEYITRIVRPNYKAVTPPTVTDIIPSKPYAFVGETISFTIGADNWTLNSYAIYLSEVGVIAQSDTDSNVFSYCFTQAGTYIIEAASTNSAGATNLPAITYQVYGPPAVSAITPSQESAFVGDTIAFTIGAENWTINYYAIYLMDVGVVAQAATNSNIFSYCFTQAGTYIIEATSTNSAGVSNLPAITYQVYGPPTVSSITASQESATVGVTVTFTMNATDATEYAFGIGNGVDTLIEEEKHTGNTISWNFTTAGTYYIWGMAYNKAGGSAASALTYVVMEKEPSLVFLNISTTTITVLLTDGNKGTLCLASYTKNGQMLEMLTHPVQDNVSEYTFKLSKSREYVKAFLLKDDNCPACAALIEQ